jgi:inositol-phosphate transport system ATP-binding protein
MARIELIEVTKSWGEVIALDGVSLGVADGEFVAILGPSGCGKSTTLLLLAGIYAATEGRICFDGRVVNEVEARDRNVGIVFQSYALYPHMTARRNIMFPLKFKSVSEAEAKRRAEEAARLVHVNDLLERQPGQMSGGQQQRVALARALVKEPQLLLLDEPLSNLDATLRLSMRTEIKRIQRQLGVTTILVTHDQTEATTMADRIIVMNRGRIEQIGTPDDLYARPASLFVAGFIGAPPMNRLDGTARAGHLRVGSLALACHGDAEGEVVLGVRPEAIGFAEGGGLPGRIEDVEPMGREILYFIDTPLGPLRMLQTGAPTRRGIGESVAVTFEPADTLVFGSEGRLLPQVRAALI